MSETSSLITSAFKASTPALFGYIALGISFGFLFVKMGLPWWLAPIMSLVVYAGAAQFIALTLLANHAGLLQILGATFLVNLRHIFYGLSFLGKFPKNWPQKLYMVFGLTDEAYSILSAQKHYNSQKAFLIILLAHSYWIIGSLIGAVLGASIPFDLHFLAFALTALFVVLAVELCLLQKRYTTLGMAVVAVILGLTVFPSQMLIASLAIATLLMLLVYPWRKDHEH